MLLLKGFLNNVFFIVMMIMAHSLLAKINVGKESSIGKAARPLMTEETNPGSAWPLAVLAWVDMGSYNY